MFRSEPVSAHVSRIFDPLGVAFYLCEGTRGAALIDAGYGVRGLRAYIRSLTDKPLTVLLTHGHVDHAPGAFEFGEAYLNERDVATLEAHANTDYRLRLVRGAFPKSGVGKDELVLRPKDFRLLPLAEGDVFDLGGVSVEAHAMPGHTRGSMVMLVPQDRVVVFGDAVGPGTLIMEDFSAPISEYLSAMRTFRRAHAGRYDLVLRNHGTCESTPAVLDDAIETAEHVLAGDDARIELPSNSADILPHGNPNGLAFFSANALVPSGSGVVRADGREGNINYRSDMAR